MPGPSQEPPEDLDAILRSAGELLGRGEVFDACARFDEALALQPGNPDASYGKAFCLSRLGPSLQGRVRPEDVRIEICNRSKAVLQALSNQVVSPFTESGARHFEMLRFSYHCLAFYAMQDPKDLEAALQYANTGASLNGSEGTYIVEDQVRILLRLGRPDDAYMLVHKSLLRDPRSVLFQDVRNDPGYASWTDGGGPGRYFSKGPVGETAAQALDRFDAWVKSHLHLYYDGVSYGPPLRREELAAFERENGFTLPPGYVRLLTERGAPSFQVNTRRSGDLGSRDVLSPSEIRRVTDDFRSWHEESDDEEEANLSKLFVFQYHDDEGDPDGYVFDLSDPKPGGEFGIGSLLHDAPYDGAFADTFDEHLRLLVDEMIEENI